MSKGGTKFGATVHKNYVDFAVWAPSAKQVWVHLETDEGKFSDFEMISIHPGIWETKLGLAKPGMRYKYKIQDPWDNIIYRNDPYARALSGSIDGFSLIIKDTFKWPDTNFRPAPPQEQVIYELHVGTFNQPIPGQPGTMNDVIKKLAYLKSLGVNMLEIMPVTSTPYYNDRGYGPSHLFSVEERLGGRVEFQRLIRSAHKHGIGVILDVVYNHLAIDHNELWQFDGWNENGRGGIYFYNDDRANTPWGARPDYGRKEVRRYVLDNVRMWLEEFRLDGLRLDSTHYIRSYNGTDNLDDANPEGWKLLQEISAVAHKINPRALIIAEDLSTNDYLTKPVATGGAGFDAQWGLGFPTALRAAFGIGTNQSLNDLAAELNKYYNGDFRQKIIFSESHDTASKADGHERLDADFDAMNPLSLWAQQKVLLAAGLTLTAPGVPMLLAGQEFMQPGGFSSLEPLDWELSRAFSPNIVLAHKRLTNLRKTLPDLTAGDFNLFHLDPINQVLAYTRGQTLIIANFGATDFEQYTLTPPSAGTFTPAFNSSDRTYHPEFPNYLFGTLTTDADQKLTLPLANHSLVILSQQQ